MAHLCFHVSCIAHSLFHFVSFCLYYSASLFFCICKHKKRGEDFLIFIIWGRCEVFPLGFPSHTDACFVSTVSNERPTELNYVMSVCMPILS